MSLQFDSDFGGFPLYEELEVSPRASDEVIRAAYGRLVRVHRANEARVRRLNSAFDVLSNPGKRAAYDSTGIEGGPSPKTARPRKAQAAGDAEAVGAGFSQPSFLVLGLSLATGLLAGLEIVRLFASQGALPFG